MKLLVLNGPNLNMLGIREKDIYGSKTYADLEKMIFDHAKEKGVEIEVKQSNCEGKLVTFIQEAYQKVDGIIINPAAYTHTSIAILDALKAVSIPFIEVHISDVSSREEFRKISYIAPYAKKRIIGHGFEGYIEAIDEFLK
ncbi:MAG: type II 3-dehydroquinate dehydratase [Bacilli bacterium]|nr:type II 3-dehydroquinate dehydratase [Bacilli bacterium]